MSAVQFQAGDKVEVLDLVRGVWLHAVVAKRWRCTRVEVGSGFRVEDGDEFYQYDCDGNDEQGPFHGRWDGEHVWPRSDA